MVNNGQKRKMWSHKAVVSSDITLVFICVEVIHDGCAMMKLSKNVCCCFFFSECIPLVCQNTTAFDIEAPTGEVALPD